MESTSELNDSMSVGGAKTEGTCLVCVTECENEAYRREAEIEQDDVLMSAIEHWLRIPDKRETMVEKPMEILWEKVYRVYPGQLHGTQTNDDENRSMPDEQFHGSKMKSKLRRNTTLIASTLDGSKAAKRLQNKGLLNEEEMQDIISEKYKTSELLMTLFSKTDSDWVAAFMDMLQEEDISLYKMVVNTDLNLCELDHHELVYKVAQSDNINIKAKGVKEMVRKNWMIITREIASKADKAVISTFGNHCLEAAEFELLDNLGNVEGQIKGALIFLLGKEDHAWALEFIPFLKECIGIQSVRKIFSV